MTARMPGPARVPTGQVDQVRTVACDWTARPPLLIITTLQRNPSDVGDDAFRTQHVTTVQVQFGELLLERIREALTPPTPSFTIGAIR